MNTYMIRVVTSEYETCSAEVKASRAITTPQGELQFLDGKGHLVAAFSTWIYFKQIVEDQC